jgi:hypothetical protein
VPQEFLINKKEEERIKSLAMICEHNKEVKDGTKYALLIGFFFFFFFFVHSLFLSLISFYLSFFHFLSLFLFLVPLVELF